MRDRAQQNSQNDIHTMKSQISTRICAVWSEYQLSKNDKEGFGWALSKGPDKIARSGWSESWLGALLFLRFCLVAAHSMTKPIKWSVRPVKNQIGWSEFSLSAWRKLVSSACSEDFDQTDLSLRCAHMQFSLFCRAATELLSSIFLFDRFGQNCIHLATPFASKVLFHIPYQFFFSRVWVLQYLNYFARTNQVPCGLPFCFKAWRVESSELSCLISFSILVLRTVSSFKRVCIDAATVWETSWHNTGTIT